MSSEHAVQIVAVQGIACIEEQKYQRAFRALIEHAEAFRAAHRAIVTAWFTEHYAAVRYHISSGPLFQGRNIEAAGTKIIIENPGELPCPVSQIQAELDTYLEQLEGR